MTEQAAAKLLKVLEKTVSNNPEDQKQALDYLAAAGTENFSIFVQCLSLILRTQQCQSFVRQAAGLQLKNALAAKDIETKHMYLQRWLSLPVNERTEVKGNVLATLGTEPSRPSIAAQCVSAIACAELPTGLWPDVIGILMTNVTNVASGEMLKESSLETLGYVCQDIEAKVLEQQANDILTAIVHGMRKEETSIHVRLAATNALLNSLEFTKRNFSNEQERNIIMQVACETTQSNDLKVKVAALQGLSRIVSLYYGYMDAYMANALFPITIQAIKSEESEVAMQGMEFWSTVAEVEIDLAMEAEEAEEKTQAPENTSRHYMKGACQHLCPILLENMAKHDDDDDDDDWSTSKAAGVCVMLMAQCVGDTILENVMPFLHHIASNDWKYKEAAILAFASVLDGPDRSKLLPLIQQAMPALIDSMQHPKVQVRDTVAFALGRVIESCPDIVNDVSVLESFLPALSTGLTQEPRVAANVCWALVSLVKTAYESATAKGTDASGQPETFNLSQVFGPMITELIKVTDRTDGNQSNLRIAAYEALMELINNSPKDCYSVVQNTTLLMLKKLEQILNMEAAATSANDKAQLLDLQALLCATLQSVVRKMRAEDLPRAGEHIMNGLLQIMARTAVSGLTRNVMEEALIAVSTLIETLGKGFAPYMESLKPYLLRGLGNHEESQVCGAAVGVVTDLCRALEKDIVPHLDQIVELLLGSLQSPRLNRDVKVQIISSFGDIALAIEDQFERYVEVVMRVLGEAQTAAYVSNPDDLDQIDYVDSLRDAILSTYTGIFQGSRPADETNAECVAKARQAISRFAGPMCEMITKCCEMEPVPPSESLMSTASGLIGDLVVLYGSEILPLLNNDKVNNMLNRGRKGKTSKARSVAGWASKEIRKAMNKGQQGQTVDFSFKS
ncbi:unnamed protein product [Caenorhabditis auriculariae]|uniref:Importin N-terminal domain-containing protein n=1 Tax=Caenorhabditis auriculariae TaxID=2777116 RepID=A0A8S1GSE1_9PELO|nr:unnamed protein product [Caenorhabditis auriculariae]